MPHPAASPLLIIDDDAALCELLTTYLRNEGFSVESAGEGHAGLRRALSGDHALLILDVMLPDLDGLALLQELRRHSSLPVIMLSARGEDNDRIRGLELGADDYLAKPFNPRELLARIRALKRRLAQPVPANQPIPKGDLLLDPAARSVLRDGLPIVLTGAEFALLQVLLRHAGHVMTRENLALEALQRPLGCFDRSIDVHISSLRKKLGPHPDGNERIRALRGRGYQYVDAAPTTSAPRQEG